VEEWEDGASLSTTPTRVFRCLNHPGRKKKEFGNQIRFGSILSKGTVKKENGRGWKARDRQNGGADGARTGKMKKKRPYAEPQLFEFTREKLERDLSVKIKVVGRREGRKPR